MYLIIIAVVEKVDERRLIKVEMEILGDLQAKDRVENQATTIQTNEIEEEPQNELLDQCRDEDCRDRNCLITDHHD